MGILGDGQIEFGKARAVTSEWQYQVRFDVSDPAMAESIRQKLRDPGLERLFEILARHHAAPKCQFDAFAEYVAAAEVHGVESYPLYIIGRRRRSRTRRRGKSI